MLEKAVVAGERPSLDDLPSDTPPAIKVRVPPHFPHSPLPFIHGTHSAVRSHPRTPPPPPPL